MIHLKPYQDIPLRHCLNCQSDQVVSEGVFFQGMHVLSKLKCKVCEYVFHHTLPIGHALHFPIAFASNGELAQYAQEAASWLAEPLLQAMKPDSKYVAKPTVNIYGAITSPEGSVVIINCLDDCFGHVFSKLWNISFVKQKYAHSSVIVIVPENMRWLVPHSVDEVWAVGLPMSRLNYLLTGFNEFVHTQLQRFEKVLLSQAYTHLDVDQVNLTEYLKVKRFELPDFTRKPPRVTFILREDRFWHANRIDTFLNKVAIKLKKASWLRKYLCYKQNKMVARVSHQLRKAFKDVEIGITGFGRTGKFASYITDNRVEKGSSEVERQWCEWYASSHLVIGVHGSNMLIPSALSAGFIEILSVDKIRHMAEDTIQPYPNRYSQFLGRHLPDGSAPFLVSQHAISMIKHFPYLMANTNQTI